MAKLAGPNCRAASKELNTNTGWSPRCHVSVTDSRGYHPEWTSAMRASASVTAARVARSEAFWRERGLHGTIDRQQFLRGQDAPGQRHKQGGEHPGRRSETVSHPA